VVPQLIRHGRLIRPTLGIMYYPDENLLRREGIQGVLVLSVTPGSGAEAAGLQGTQRTRNGRLILGDIIKKIDGTAIDNTNALLDALERHQVGDVVEVTFERDGKLRTVKVQVQAPPP
jgi:S1-C subfamily serine protease